MPLAFLPLSTIPVQLHRPHHARVFTPLRPTHPPVAARSRRITTPLHLCASSPQDDVPPTPPPPREFSPLVKELRSVLRKCSIYFVGPMGSGKSSIAKYLASQIGFRFLDTDQLVEAVAKKPISQIFEDDGETIFRDIETAVLDQVAPFIACCVATGGGAVLRKENWGRLQTGIVIYLDTPVDVLADRLMSESESGSRPLLKDANDLRERIDDILHERRGLYEQADLAVKVTKGMAVDDIGTDIIRLLTNFIKANPPRMAQLYPGTLSDKENK